MSLSRWILNHCGSVSFLVLGACVAWLLFPAAAQAVPANPNAAEVAQPDGSKVLVKRHGDEFFSWDETVDGYPIVQDLGDGYWKYAKPTPGKAAFEAIPDARVGRVRPDAVGAKRGAFPDREKVRKHVAAEELRVKGTPGSSPLPGIQGAPISSSSGETAPDEPPPSGIPVSGTTSVKNIVILASFNDHWDATNSTVLSSKGRASSSEYANLFNQTGHTTDGAVGSVKDYFQETSYGKLTVDSVIVPWVHLPQDESYYGTDTISKDANWLVMISDAIEAATTAGFDFSQGDADGDGWVDCLTVIHSGHGQESTPNPSTCIWSKKGALSSVVTKNGVKMKQVHTEPSLRGLTTSTSIIRIGVICHEMGHFFGLPDLYDYSPNTDGLGDWCLMSGGSWNGSDGKRPAHFSAWPKYMLGFVNPVPVRSQGTVSIANVEVNPVVHILRDGVSNGEYFLLENRSKTGFDNDSTIFPGIVIYHVDSKSGNNDLGTWTHPAVKIEEADGNNSLGAKTASSQAGDVWTATSGLSGGFQDQTGNQSTNAMLYQSTHFYNRADSSDYYTNIRLNAFSTAAGTMTYSVSTVKPTVTSQSLTTPDYIVSWGTCTNATQYEVQEGTPVTLTSFSDGGEDADAMNDNWTMTGAVRDTGGARTGGYSYAMHQYYGGKWYPTVQAITMRRKPFKVLSGTNVSFYFLSNLPTGNGYLKCQISNDSGTIWKTLGIYSGHVTAWTLRNYDFTAMNAAGIGLNDQCILRFVTDFEYASGWSAYPGYGYALDDISISGAEIQSYGNWTTLDSSVPGASYNVTGKTSGVYAYQAQAYVNGAWQGFGDLGTVTVDLPLTATVNQAAAQADPTGVSPVNFTVVFSEEINPASFAGTDVVITGTAGGSKSVALTTSDNITWNAEVTGMTTPGTVVADLPAGAVAGAADSAANTASTSTDNTVMWDNEPPAGSVIINGGAASAMNPSVSLALSYGDGSGTGVAQMRFNDGSGWGEWESVAAAKAWTFSAGDGLRTVYAQLRDAAGNESTGAIEDSIMLDTAPPVITLSGANPAAVECGSVYADAGATAIDNIAGDLTGNILVFGTVNVNGPGTYTVHYSVSDGNGNSSADTVRIVQVADTTAPVISLVEGTTVTLERGTAYVDPGATAMDACVGDLASSIEVVNPVNSSTAGVYSVRYNVSDGNGNNAAEVVRLVKVVEKTSIESVDWTWMKGPSAGGMYGTNGSLGVPDPANTPGIRHDSVSWTDSLGTLWLFGGFGYGDSGYCSQLNDLWKYEPTVGTWTWVKGASAGGQGGVYGTLGTPDSANTPGGRSRAVSWIDGSDALWILGGVGMDGSGNFGYLNDLWKYDPATGNWAWMKGSMTREQCGTYGALGTPAATNVPGARWDAVSWLDASGNLWLFGGWGHAITTGSGLSTLNDLWKYDPATGNWAWMQGSSAHNQSGSYGTFRTPSAANTPGARFGAISWVDPSGQLWLFGGIGWDSMGNYGGLNDLWKYDPATGLWTWMKGSSTADHHGVYGELGTPNPVNTPGARWQAVPWADDGGNLWLYGGGGYDGQGGDGYLNDLWKYNPDTGNWTWVKGSSTANRAGVCGTLGISEPDNAPGSRDAMVSWNDGDGGLWIFGGYGYDCSGNESTLGDLWYADVNATALTVTVNQAASQADPATVFPVKFDVVFSEPVTGFGWSDVVWDGTATGVTGNVSGSDTVYTINVTASGNGTLQPSIPAGSCTNALGQKNSASTSVDNTVTKVQVSITVTSPNGGELWAPGSAHAITWDASALTGNVAILLHDMAAGTYVSLATAPALSGSYPWTVPAGQAAGSMYKIRVASLSNSAVYDYSNNHFAIGSGTPSIRVTSANGGEIWQPNSAHAITWNANALAGKVVVLLHDMSLGTYSILATVPALPGSWSWTVPAGQTIGGMYKIRVASLTNAAAYDYSDDYFAIGSGAPSITVTSPNGGEALTRGTSSTITWNSNCVIGTMKVYLYNYTLGVAEAVTTGFKPASNGLNTFSWTIPPGHATGTKFKMRVIDTRGTMSDFSNGFFTIN